MSAVSLADVKTHLQMTNSTNDTELQRFINVAETAIGHRTGPLTPVEVVEKHDGGSNLIVLRKIPVASLTSAGYADGTDLDTDDLDLDTDTGILRWGYNTAGVFTAGSRYVTVTYQSGYSALPADLAHAVKELVRHLWQTQRGNNAGRPTFDEEPVAGAFSSWPIRVQELIAPYDRGPVVA